MEKNNYDIENCTWCNGAGFNQAFNGKANPPNCVRCEGSGKIYVKDELATTKSRRKYMGPVPKPIEEVTVIIDELTDEAVAAFQAITEPKRRGRKPGSKNKVKEQNANH